jgi:hypothetical protein
MIIMKNVANFFSKTWSLLLEWLRISVGDATKEEKKKKKVCLAICLGGRPKFE